ncbi:VOC family protein [Lutimaribacter marinistellae]|uniref:VOC family protein n=1 Tax=Lutimaribacter marinistellae TaxID=1820329 RepID=A0ABV7TKQ2_9RHOB
MTQSKAGQIVWHDLFTSDRERSMDFYQHIADWTYQVERATDFAWGGGEKDFVLALLGDEAGAGFAVTPPRHKNSWIAYVEVPDVDAALKHADALGGEIVRTPFEVPGVGRNALVRDPLGVLFGLSLSRHSFPVPHRQFGPEVYVGSGDQFPKAFYAELFEWQMSPKRELERVSFSGPSGDVVAVQYASTWPRRSNPAWVPSIKVTSVSDASNFAEINGARLISQGADKAARAQGLVLRDPDGALFALEVG